MPKAQQNKTYKVLSKGLITEAGPLNFPEDATTDELNCELTRTGNRKRRKGFDPENDFALSTQTVASALWSSYAIHTSTWNTAGGIGGLNFTVLQVGPTLYFYDSSVTTLSTGQKSFTVDLNDYLAIGAVSVEQDIVQVASGKGWLFVSGEKIDSFYIEYDLDTDDITVTEILIEIRDFEGVDDGLTPDEQPSTLTDLHRYNLQNQGWNSPAPAGADPITEFDTSQTTFPSNSQQWWPYKSSGFNFDPVQLQKTLYGNTLAPKGHYILSAFNQDRTTASGISGLTTDTVTARPRSVSFFAGRAWYAGVAGVAVNGNIYFSQIISEDGSNVGKCYQVNDPTSEALSDLLSSDGGVIVIPDVGAVLATFPLQNALIILADNGVWSVTAGTTGFRATDFSVAKISSLGIDSPESLVDVNGFPVWWSHTGILTLSQNANTDRFEIKNLSEGTIHTFYDEIPALSKFNVAGCYDSIERKIHWLYSSTAPAEDLHRYRFDSVLILDIQLGAFIPWQTTQLASTPYYIGGVFTMDILDATLSPASVYDVANVVEDSGDSIVALTRALVANDLSVNFLCFKEGASVVQWTFGNFTNDSFLDWFSGNNVGISYESYFETGDELMGDIQRNKQAVYVQCYFNKTETAYATTAYTSWDHPSSCFMQSKWDWSDHSNSGKFTSPTQVYRFRKAYVPSSGLDFDNGFAVVVTKNKIRGTGKALRLKFTSEEGKDFDILGWAILFSGVTDV